MATLDVLSASEAAEAIGAPGQSTTKVAKVVTAASKALDSWAGPVVVRTITGERHDRTLGRPSIELRRWPVASVSSLTEYDSSGSSLALTEETHSSKPSGAFLLERAEAEAELGLYRPVVWRRDSGRTSTFAETVVATYVAGRFATTAAVDERYKEAARLLLVNLWQRVQTGRANLDEFTVPRYPFPTFAVPNSVRELLADVWQEGPGRQFGIA